MAQSLQIRSNSHSPEPRHSFTNFYSDYANDDTLVQEYERMMVSFEIVWMIFDVPLNLAAIFKKDLAPNVMESTPLLVGTGRAQFMFCQDH